MAKNVPFDPCDYGTGRRVRGAESSDLGAVGGAVAQALSGLGSFADCLTRRLGEQDVGGGPEPRALRSPGMVKAQGSRRESPSASHLVLLGKIYSRKT